MAPPLTKLSERTLSSERSGHHGVDGVGCQAGELEVDGVALPEDGRVEDVRHRRAEEVEHAAAHAARLRAGAR